MEKSIFVGGLKPAMVSSRQHQYHTNPLLPFEATTDRRRMEEKHNTDSSSSNSEIFYLRQTLF
jgi:hypothetical protein